ncbi:hypothetical protein [Bradyrhizobium sp. ERR14]|uniref:hypothetical protein n=1 Tax=Bradyrhizobium sp. ERR14 TaxID=2663837 RepID=UPI00160E5019|nr:hypothetical protein [Bradyrhizobium sp. ERR14]MBB4398746.1 hypothetical protein [Bradyrhizobium sp. ERR14]
MPNDNSTRGYPLPHPDNIAREDAQRIREAIEQISADMTAMEGDSAVASETVVGIVRLATEAEANAGTSTAAVPVVKRVKDMISAGISATVPSAISTAIANLVGTAPTTLDTLGEIAAAIENDRDTMDVLNAAIGAKLSKSANLSDLTNVATARTNLGLAALALKATIDSAALIADGVITYAKLASGAVSTVADFCSNTASKLLSVNSLWGSAAPLAISGASGTVSLDFASRLNFHVQATGNITLVPTNLKDGQAFGIRISKGTASLTIALGNQSSPDAATWYPIGGTAPTTTDQYVYLSGQRIADTILYSGGKIA